MAEKKNWLLKKARVTVRPFTSEIPMLGRVIVWIRSQWGNVAARWIVQGVINQQNEFNQQMALMSGDLDARLIEQDRDSVQQRHDIGELTAQIADLNRRLEALESQCEIQEP